MSADVRQMMRLSRTLQAGGVRARLEVRAVVERGALNVKNEWRSNAVATSGRHARRYPYSVSYDVWSTLAGARAEIGPDKGRPQGALGNLLEFGSVNNPPHNDGGRALAAEAPRFAAQIAALAARAMR